MSKKLHTEDGMDELDDLDDMLIDRNSLQKIEGKRAPIHNNNFL